MRMIDGDALMKEAGRLWSDMPDGEELSKELMKAINHAPTVSGWVSVKDRMPEQNGDYLAYTRDGIVWPYFFMAGVWEDALGNSTDTVTHWMPLPEPPEEDADAVHD